jgi:hypothetical protein
LQMFAAALLSSLDGVTLSMSIYTLYSAVVALAINLNTSLCHTI